MSKKENIYIKILKYADRKGEFTMEELYDHLTVALQDNSIIQDGDRYCSSQVAYEMKTKMQGYVYRSGIKPQTYGFAPVL